jgi:hypothetical protein
MFIGDVNATGRLDSGAVFLVRKPNATKLP